MWMDRTANNDLKKLLKEKTLTDVDNDSDMADVDNETVI